MGELIFQDISKHQNSPILCVGNRDYLTIYTRRICRYYLRGGVKKAQAQLQLKLAMNVESRRKAFCNCTDKKRKAKENGDPLSKLAKKDMEKTGTVNPFFASISIRKLWP